MAGELRDLIVEKLIRLHKEYEEVPGSDWIKCTCSNPDHLDNNPSAGINTTSGILHCFSCQYNEMFIKLDDATEDEQDVIWSAKYNSLKTTPSNLAASKDSIQELTLPPVARLLSEEWRGISAEVLQDAKAYYCDTGRYRGRNIFPMYEDGMAYGFDARVVDDTANLVDVKWLRNKGAPVKELVYPKDVLIKRFPDLHHIVICEGVADVLSYIQMGVPAIASFGMSPPAPARIEELLRMGVTDITIAFDNDDAGVSGAILVLPYYSEWFNIVPHPLCAMLNSSEYKDANELLVGVKENGIAEPAGFEDTGEDF